MLAWRSHSHIDRWQPAPHVIPLADNAAAAAVISKHPAHDQPRPCKVHCECPAGGEGPCRMRAAVRLLFRRGCQRPLTPATGARPQACDTHALSCATGADIGVRISGGGGQVAGAGAAAAVGYPRTQRAGCAWAVAGAAAVLPPHQRRPHWLPQRLPVCSCNTSAPTHPRSNL